MKIFKKMQEEILDLAHYLALFDLRGCGEQVAFLPHLLQRRHPLRSCGQFFRLKNSKKAFNANFSFISLFCSFRIVPRRKETLLRRHEAKPSPVPTFRAYQVRSVGTLFLFVFFSLLPNLHPTSALPSDTQLTSSNSATCSLHKTSAMNRFAALTSLAFVLGPLTVSLALCLGNIR